MALVLARDLVRSVARAFYPDDYIVVLDILTIRKYVIDTETSGKSPLEAQFNLTPKQVRTILKDLNREGLIQYKETQYINYHAALTEGKALRKSKRILYYINYRHFYQLVLLRISLLKKLIEKNDTKKIVNDNQAFLCPSCGRFYSILQAQKRLDKKTFKPLCAKCFDNPLAKRISFLTENVEQKKHKGKTLADKRNEQLNSEDKFLERENIMGILLKLQQLSLQDIPMNLPHIHIEADRDKFMKFLERKKLNQEVDDKEYDEFVRQLQAMKQEDESVVPTAALFGVNSSKKQNEKDQDVVDLTEENSERNELRKAQTEVVHTKTYALPSFLKTNALGEVASHAMEDAKERQEKKLLENMQTEEDKQRADALREKTSHEILEDLDEELGGAVDMLKFRKSLRAAAT
eukprot:augustus_masked-scaffold_5-processed-gene-8.24-mRNA-1 protein AED:1.00 eAED:1.00 QI:0/-1/0/0/-1/1/1/0/405